MKNVFRLSIVTFLVSAPFILSAQADLYKEVSIASPNAAALHKYGDYPVSYHTGTPNISIPLHTVVNGTLSLPLSLSYNASGLKVAEISSWVGAGWSLSSGGVISRTVRGTPDERGTGTVAGMKGYMSDKGYSSYLEYNYMGSLVSSNFSQFLSGQLDGEPDIFHFNVGGASGKFFINDAGNVVLMPMQDVAVTYDYDAGSSSASIKSFTLTVQNGTKYYFGRTASTTDIDPIEITRVASNVTGTAMGNVVSSWYLNRVESHDGLFAINLNYESENYSYYSITNSTYAENAQIIDNKDFDYAKSVVSGVRLKSIEFANGKVEFIANYIRQDLGSASPNFGIDDMNTDAKALNEILIKNTEGLIEKKVLLEYAYFEDNTTALPVFSIHNVLKTDKKRLKLLAVQEIAADNSTEPKTQFDYFSEFVPRRLSLSIDHWGYYNGKPNLQMIPTYTKNNYTVVVPGANRESSWPEMRAAALKKITYPTGGATEFEFEPHTFNAAIPQNMESEIGRVNMGYDGNNAAKEFTTTLGSGVSFGARVINTTQPTNSNGNATLTIYKPDNTFFASITAVPGSSVQQNFTAPIQGLYRFVLQKSMVFTGYGAEATAYTNSTGQALTDQLIGGLRIKKMITKDQLTNASTTTEYDYSENNVSSGILYGRPTYVQVVRNDELKTFGWYTSTTDQSTDNKSPNGCLCAETNNGTDNQYSFKSAVTIRPMEVTQGGHIGYSTVTVRKVGNGKTVFKFFGQEPWVINRHDIVNRNLNNSFCDPTVPGFPFIPLKEDYRRGATKSEWVFDENGTWLSSKNYELEYTETIESTPAVIVASAAAASGISIFGGNGTNNAMLGSYYHLKTAKKTHYKETTILYPSMTNPIITEATSFFESPYHTQQTKLLTYDSKGVPKQTVVKYSADFMNTYLATLNNGESTYTSAAQTAWTNAQIAVGSCVTNGCKWNALHTYRITLKNARQQYLNTMAANFTNSNSSFNTIFNNYYATASNTLKAIMQLQKGKMLYPIEGREIVGDIVVNAYFNEFSISTESPNRVYPTKLYTLKESKPTTQFAMATHDNYSISKDPGYEVEAISTYVSGNVVESVSKNGVTTSYLWGYNNSFPIAKAIGASYSNLNAAYIQNNNLLTGLKNQPILSTAQVTTYTYAPLIGMTTQTDPNGRTTYYEYDPFNRLKLIKDQNGNIVKQFCYNYANQPINCYTTDYKNIEAYSGQFTRNNCPAGYTGSTVTYTVPANTVTSSISQADANAKAQQKVQQEGQAYANANGTCTPTPTCNESVCMASGPEYRCVNGVCEVGFKVYTASLYVGGMYECYYRYEWSDGYWADGYMEISPYACLLSVIY